VVRATDISNVGPPSNIDLATTLLFTDDPVVLGVTIIKATHIAQLRIVINAVRAAGGLSPATYIHVVVAGATISAEQFVEMRLALDGARSLGLSAVQYTDSALRVC
jgi:hypothetical protein